MGIPYAEVIGDPIAHSKSPLIHKFWLDKLGLEGDYKATRVTSAGLPAYFADRRRDPNWRGCNVTMPHKRSIYSLVDHVDASAEWAGSINCVYWDGDELWGCNTDASGIAMAIDHNKIGGNAVALIGTGAAASTALWCLASEEVEQVRIVARNRASADHLISEMKVEGRSFDFEATASAFADCMVVINATPLGMRGFPDMPEPVLAAIRRTRPEATAFDMVYDPPHTQFLETAEALGRQIVGGIEMLVGQAQDSFMHFFPGEPYSLGIEASAMMEQLRR